MVCNCSTFLNICNSLGILILIMSSVRLEVIEEEKMLLSSSVDCTVRLWSLDGEYIGK